MHALTFLFAALVLPHLVAVPGGDRLPTVYAVRYVEPCTASRLEVGTGGPDAVQYLAVGPASPVALLRYDALVTARLRVLGAPTGRVHQDAECGPTPELAVLAFAPIAPIARAFCEGCLDGAVQVYNGARPRDAFVPEDFAAGPESPRLDAARCRAAPRRGCPAGTLAQPASDGRALCCPLRRP